MVFSCDAPSLLVPHPSHRRTACFLPLSRRASAARAADCQHLRPIWEQLAAELEGEGILVGKVTPRCALSAWL